MEMFFNLFVCFYSWVGGFVCLIGQILIIKTKNNFIKNLGHFLFSFWVWLFFCRQGIYEPIRICKCGNKCSLLLVLVLACKGSNWSS